MPKLPANQNDFHHSLQDVAVEQACKIQNELRTKVLASDAFKQIQFVGGADVGYFKSRTRLQAAVVVLTFPELELHEFVTSQAACSFPYVPGLLSFRETPAVLTCLERLKQPPDLLLCDGQGVAHPRRFGLACHLGVLSGLPTIGVAKSRLIGTHAPLSPEKGSSVPLVDKGETVGLVVRTRAHVKPVYVSVGHKISLPTAKAWVLRCVTKFRLPETTRLAHRYASNFTS
ncbi:MAG: deoxyribonuclease V [bacterium]